MDGNESLKLTDKEISDCFSDPLWGTRFPPILTLEQAAELLQIPEQTIYQWRSQGRLGSCCRKIGKHLRFYRARLIKLAFNQGIIHEEG
jgi:excisionase family DNA binding protein